ncbi:MAG: polysaccharide biosynthesis tyrosine autokinase, partial [Pseudomonadota bacterium]
AAMEAEVEAKRTEVAGLEADLESRQAVASQADTAEIGLRALEREARSDQDLLNSFLQSSKDVAQRFDIQEPDARILSQAFVPQSPSFPDKKLFMVIAIVIGAFIGLLLAYIEELLDQTFRSGDEVETAFGIPAVAIPKIGRPGWRIPFLDYVLARPASVFAENIRSLRTLLWLNDTHTRANCIVVTSARSGEGKTTTAVALARASALGGEKVVLVDCDLSRPSVHNTFKLQGPDIGLTDLLASRADRQDVTRTDPNMANLQYITAGKDVKNGSELLRSDNMISLIRELRKEYDLVIIDTPPTLTVSDAKVLGTMADAVLFCVRGRTTTYSTAMAGIKSLTDVGANVLCVALTQVRFKSLRRSERNDYEVYARGRANRMS